MRFIFEVQHLGAHLMVHTYGGAVTDTQDKSTTVEALSQEERGTLAALGRAYLEFLGMHPSQTLSERAVQWLGLAVYLALATGVGWAALTGASAWADTSLMLFSAVGGWLLELVNTVVLGLDRLGLDEVLNLWGLLG